MIQHLRDARILDALAYLAGHRGAHAQAEHILQRGQIHVLLEVHGIQHVFNRTPEEKLLTDLVQLGRHRNEIFVAGLGARRICRKRGLHLGHVLLQIEHGAVLEEAAPLRIEPAEIERVRHRAASLGEDALQHTWHSQDGRPHVEPVAILLEDGRLAAEPIVLLEQHHLMAAGCERAGGGQAGQACADDGDGVRGGGWEVLAVWHRCEFLSKEGSKAFFFEKKKQKTFDYALARLSDYHPSGSKSFLVLFFKK